MHRHHSRALATVAGALVLDAALGLAFAAVTPHLTWWHGLFCALANAVTDGGDAPPVNAPGYAITALEYVTVVPLFAAAFSLFTSGLADVAGAEERIKRHVSGALRHHLGGRP